MASGGGSRQHEHGARDAGVEERHPFLGRGHRQPRRRPLSAARATATAPCPYPSALTTAHSAGRGRRHAAAAGRCAAPPPRSISAHAGQRPHAARTHAVAAHGGPAHRRTPDSQRPPARPGPRPRGPRAGRARRPGHGRAPPGRPPRRGSTPRARKAADDARQHVAGPGRGEAGRPPSTSSTGPPGAATTVVDPLSSTTAPQRRANPPAAVMRSGPGGAPAKRVNSPSCGVSTTGTSPVRRPRRATTAPIRRPCPAHQTVGVDHRGQRRPGHHAAHVGTGGSGAPEPGTEDKGPAPLRHRQRVVGPALGRQGHADGFAHRELVRGRRRGRRGGPSPPRHGTRRGRTARPRPSCPASPATTASADCHLCVAGTAGHGRATSASSTTDVARSTSGRCRPPRPVRPAGPVALDQAGLEGAERDRPVGRQGSADARPVSPSRPRGCRRRAPAPRRGRAGRAYVPGTRSRRRRRSRGRPRRRPDAIGGVSRVDHASPEAPSTQAGGGDAAVGTVVPLAGHDHDVAAVGAAEHAAPPTSPRPCRPARRGLLRDRRAQRRGVDGPHLARSRSTRLQWGVPSATTVAMATVSVWVIDTCHRPTPRSRLSRVRPRPSDAAPGAPLSPRDHSTSRKAASPDTDAQCLQHRLFGGEADGQAGTGVTTARRVVPLGLGEQALHDAGAALEDPAEPRHVDGVDTDATDSPAPRSPAAVSLHRDGLGQVAGPVDVVPVQPGDVVREQLQRHHVEHRREQGVGLRDPQHLVGL